MALTLGELSGVISLDDKPFQKGLDGAQSKLADFGSKGKIVAAAAGVAIAGALAAGIAKSMDVGKANDKLAAQLGLNAKESEKAGKIAGKLYAGAYGDSIDDVNNAIGAVMSSIKGMRTASEADVEAMTAKVMDLAEAFEIDAGRAAQVAGQMITTGLAKDGVEAADLLAGSLQKVPSALREDLLDAVDEYGPFFRDLGIKGSDAMGMLASASEKGMYGIDKTGDALKEFTIRSTDMSKATGTAYETLGLDTQEMTNRLLAGGDTASGAFGEIIHGLQSMEDPGERAATALALFGTPLEDLSVTEIPKFLGTIDPMGDAFDTMEGKAAALGETLADNASTKIESWKRTAEMAFIDVLGGKVLPVVEKVAGFLTDTFSPIIGEITGGFEAFAAAWVANDGDITSSGFPGFMENLAYQLRQAFDYVSGTVIPKLAEFAKFLMDNQIILITIAAAVGGYALALGALSIIATVRGWIAAAAAAQWGLNAAMAANPVGLVVAGIAALVAGVIWAYHNIGWFKDGVDAAFKWIGEAAQNVGKWFTEAFQNVVNWWTNTLLPAIGAVGTWFTDLFTNIGNWARDFVGFFVDGWGMLVNFWNGVLLPGFQAVGAAIGAVFQGIYNFLKPVFDSIGTIFNGFYLAFQGIFQLVSSLITYVVAPLFQWFWARVVEAFTAIGRTISDWWNGAVAVFNTVVGFVRTVLATVFTWYLNSVIKPVWNAVSGAIKAAWSAISGVFNTIVTFIRTTLAAGFTWFRDNVINPVWNGIRSTIDGAWRFIRGVFDNVSSFIRTTLSAAFTWFRDTIIKPVFERIQNIIRNTWEQDIKPVFTALSDFIMKTIPKAFDDGVKFVKTAWDKLQEIAKAPVRFVVDTVINDGLIGAFNTIAGILPGIDKLPRVALPAGFADGGYTGNGGKYQPAGIVHAGEYVFTKEQTKRAGVGNLAAMAHSLTGYANGGRVAPLKHLAVTQGYNRVHKGIDYAAAEGTPVYATQNGVVNHAGPGARAPGVWGGNEVHIAGSGLETWFAHLSRIGVGLGQRVRAGQQIGLSGNTGISSGPHLHFGVFNGGWPNDIDPNAYLGGAGVPDGKGFNPIAGIIDGLVSKFKDNFPGGGMFADMAIGIGKKILDGATKWVTDTLGGGDKKGNVAAPTVYDGGGWLENTGGPQLVQHNKSKPDAVLSHDQWETMRRIAENAGNGLTYSPTIQYMGEDPETLLRRDKARFVDLLNATAS